MDWREACEILLFGGMVMHDHVEYALKDLANNGKRMICYEEMDMSWQPAMITENMMTSREWEVCH